MAICLNFNRSFTCWRNHWIFIARTWFKNYLDKNPPVTEQMVREMMRQMGRTPSERQVRQVMATMTPPDKNKDKKKPKKEKKAKANAK